MHKIAPKLWITLIGLAAPTLILGFANLDQLAVADGPGEFYSTYSPNVNSSKPQRFEDISPIEAEDEKSFYSQYSDDSDAAIPKKEDVVAPTTKQFLGATGLHPIYSPNNRTSASSVRLGDVEGLASAPIRNVPVLEVSSGQSVALNAPLSNSNSNSQTNLPQKAVTQIQQDIELPSEPEFTYGQSVSEPMIVALIDLIEEAEREEQESPSDTLPTPTDINRSSGALFEDDNSNAEDANAEKADDEKDTNEEDKDEDDETPVDYPTDLTQLPSHIPLSIGDARRGALENNKDIRVIAYEPSEAAEEISIESAEFDTTLTVDVDGGKLDEQVSSQIQAQGINIDALQTDFFTPQDDELGGLVLQKKLRTGGTVQWGYNADYNFFTPSGNFVTVNPAWLSRTTMKIEQPLFKGRGALIALAPIETAQAEQQVSSGEFNTLVQETLRDLEVAYWEAALTANSYKLLQDASRRAYETLHREEELIEAGRGSLPDSLQAEEQYRTLRSELADAKAAWGTASREIYRLLGVPHSQQQGFVWTTETPAVESLIVDPSQAEAAVRSHPQYEGQLAAIRAAEIEVRTAANALQPDLAVRFAYAFSGLADGLDDAIDIMVDRRYNNWTAGVVFRHPFGRRAELANVRKSHLALSREFAALDQFEHDLL